MSEIVIDLVKSIGDTIYNVDPCRGIIKELKIVGIDFKGSIGHWEKKIVVQLQAFEPLSNGQNMLHTIVPEYIENIGLESFYFFDKDQAEKKAEMVKKMHREKDTFGANYCAYSRYCKSKFEEELAKVEASEKEEKR